MFYICTKCYKTITKQIQNVYDRNYNKTFLILVRVVIVSLYSVQESQESTQEQTAICNYELELRISSGRKEKTIENHSSRFYGYTTFKYCETQKYFFLLIYFN